jgi:two-component sensor histidine kinase
LEALSRIGAEVLPPERLMHHVVAQVSRVTHIERSKIMRFRPERGDLLVEAGVGWKPGVVGRTSLSADHRSPAGRAFQTGQPVAIHNFSEAPEYYLPELLRQHNIVSLLNVPVMINGFTWGVLEVDSTKPTLFDEWDINFLTILANVMGACLALHTTEQQKVDLIAEKARERAQSDIAFRELQHRVKNNLQIIIAFLSTKMREGSEDVAEKLTSVIARVQAISLAHDLLSTGQHGNSSVDFADYLRSLCRNIDPQRSDLTIEVAAQQVRIPIDRAVRAGLVVNELVTNSIKYAFGNRGGRIAVRFAPISNASEACVSVEDDGIGMAIPPKKGLGLSLVDGFAQQIQGRVSYEKVETGSRIVLCFPATLWVA